MLNPEHKQSRGEEDSPPPILKSWKNIYLLVIGSLVFQVIIYYIITRIFE